ncbi:aldose 1-epimerase family protein [Microbacterium sp. NPDC055683]
MLEPLSGRQWVLRAAGYEAVVAGIGATLRSLRDSTGDLIVPFDADRPRPGMRGALLAPWPNRTADGRYRFADVEHQLPLNEPDRRNAVHGLVAWLRFDEITSAPDQCVLTATIEAQPGYPWRVRLEVRFSLSARGLEQRVTAVNETAEPVPFGIGGHPYLVAGVVGPSAIDGWTLELPADEVLRISKDRLLPVGRSRVAAQRGALDFRRARRIGAMQINHAFTGLARGADGWARARVVDGSGAGAEIAWDRRCGWVQVYTADTPGAPDHRSGVAIEPMSCPPDAFNSREDLVVIEPGGAFETAWVVRRVRDESP